MSLAIRHCFSNSVVTRCIQTTLIHVSYEEISLLLTFVNFAVVYVLCFYLCQVQLNTT